MKQIKKGDIVVRKSYGKDIIFIVKNIISTNKGKIAILKGVVERIEADSNLQDLEILEKRFANQEIKQLNKKMNQRIKHKKIKEENSMYKIGLLSRSNRNQEKIVTGKILHLDGDKKYSEKSYYYYKKLGLNAIVKNIPEYRQPKVVYRLLEIYQPDILVITGHDGMIRRERDYYNLYNYRNSKYFIETVKEARKFDKKTGKHLVIFARSMSKLF